MAIFPTTILLATDGSEEAQQAASLAVAISKGTDSELHVVHIEEVPVLAHAYAMPDLHEDLQEENAQGAREFLEEQVKRVEEAGASVAESHLRMGYPADQIIHLGEEIGAGLIVIGSRGHGGIRRLLLGSVSETVVRYAHCPVLVARGTSIETLPTRVVLATDGSEDAGLAAKTAAELSGRMGSELHLVHVGDLRPPTHYPYPPGVRAAMEEDTFAEELAQGTKELELLDRQRGQVEEAGGEIAQIHDRTGPAPREIIALSEEIEAGLIVVGSRGLRGLERLVMGSVSESVVRYAHCPVMVVRGEPGRE